MTSVDATLDFVCCRCSRPQQLRSAEYNTTFNMAVAAVDTGDSAASIMSGEIHPPVPVFVHSRTSMAEAREGSLTKPHKRKRTRYVLLVCCTVYAFTKPLCSPQDHALLEAAYSENSKPDKIQRLSLLSQIQLSEKEVQVSLRFPTATYIADGL